MTWWQIVGLLIAGAVSGGVIMYGLIVWAAIKQGPWG